MMNGKVYVRMRYVEFSGFKVRGSRSYINDPRMMLYSGRIWLPFARPGSIGSYMPTTGLREHVNHTRVSQIMMWWFKDPVLRRHGATSFCVGGLSCYWLTMMK